MWANNALLFFLSDPFSSVPKGSYDPKGGEGNRIIFGTKESGRLAPIMSCGEIGTEKPLKRPKQSVFHHNFKTLAQINLTSLHQKGPRAQYAQGPN